MMFRRWIPKIVKDASATWSRRHGFGENTDCGNREELTACKINCLSNGLVVLGLATSHHEEKLQVRFHPHTVWSSLARTDSDGFLAPCITSEKPKPKFYIFTDKTHTHTQCCAWSNQRSLSNITSWNKIIRLCEWYIVTIHLSKRKLFWQPKWIAHAQPPSWETSTGTW